MFLLKLTIDIYLREEIYKHEENFFYLLYQGWSGYKDAHDEIDNIRSIAAHGLEKYPGAIKLYWNVYPFKNGWESWNDLIEGDVFFGTNINGALLYMPLDTLIDITNKSVLKDDEEMQRRITYWKKMSTKQQFKDLQLKDDKTTLKAVLIARGYLKAPEEIENLNK